MKVKIVLALLVLMLLSSPTVKAGTLVKTIPIMAGDTIYGKAGASVYVLDSEQSIYYPAKGGASSFVLEFSGVSCAFIPSGTTEPLFLSGATISVQHYGTNKLPRGVNVSLNTLMSAVSNVASATEATISQIIPWETAVPAFDVYSGDSEVVYAYQPLNTRYHLLRISSGLTSISGSLYLTIN